MTALRRSFRSHAGLVPVLVGAAIAWAGAASCTDAGNEGAQTPGATGPGVTVLEMVAGHAQPVLAFRTDDSTMLQLYLDTGAGANVLSIPAARRLGLQAIEKQQILNPTDGVVREAEIVAVARLEAGGLALENVAFLAVDMPQLGGLDGVLSIRALSDRLVTFDFLQRHVRIEDGALAATDEGVMRFDPHPVITVEGSVDGHTLPFHFDTGSPDGITVPGDLAKELQFFADPKVVRERGPFVVKEARLRGAVQIGPFHAEDPVLQIVDRFAGFGNLGARFLTDAVVTVDQTHGLLRMTWPR